MNVLVKKKLKDCLTHIKYKGEQMDSKCYGCKESEDTSWDGMCFLCWEDLMEHLEEEI